MSEDIKLLGENLAKIAQEIKSEVETVKNKDADWQAKHDKMVNALANTQEQIQVIKAKNEQLEAVLQRNEIDGTQKGSELEAKSMEALKSYMRGNGAGEFKANDLGLEIRGMATDNNAQGGYLVLPEMANFMATRIFETSPLRRVANVVSIGSDRMTVIADDNEASATWVGQGATASENNTPDIGLLEISAHKSQCFVSATVEMLQDGFVNVESWLQGKAADKLGRLENTAFMTGTGVAAPKGILDYAAWASAGVYERNKIEQISVGTSGALVADKLFDLQASLKEGYQGAGKFLMKRSTYGKIAQLKGSDNFYFGTTVLKDGTQGLQLLGKEVIFCDDMEAVAGSAKAIAYGDFGSGYTIVDRVGFNVLRDPYTSKGFVKFYCTKRVGGAVTNFDAIKVGVVTA